MNLLVCVINREAELERILAGFVELGITGATVVSSEGMGRFVSQGELPVLAGLQSVIDAARPQNTTVFSIVEDENTLEAAVALVERVCGDLGEPGTGIVFTVPVSRAYGLASRLPDTTNDGSG
ncbi:MAG: P-II family nitrogen regulator [Gemmatimonadales bacterium]|jgi:nitrogen regulatory protein PII